MAFNPTSIFEGTGERDANADEEAGHYEKAIDFKEQVNEQISICRHCFNRACTKQDVNETMESVKTLKSLLIYWTMREDKYMDELKKSDEAYTQKLKGLTASQKEGAEMLQMEKDHAREFFEALLSLATRKGFTIIKTSKAIIKPFPIKDESFDHETNEAMAKVDM